MLRSRTIKVHFRMRDSVNTLYQRFNPGQVRVLRDGHVSYVGVPSFLYDTPGQPSTSGD